ncbi:AAA family ATPase [Candidatus Saccharibacteria bacterium]|nr:AAA family ATPase [Candidatus Saccharibacteria bacterium]
MVSGSQEKTRLVLITGTDASGKSTLIDRLQSSNGLGVKLVEPTSWSDKAREFKLANLRTPIDEVLINQRESLYLELHRQFASNVKAELAQGYGVVTTASPLVTLVAHETMRQVISLPDHQPTETIVGNWVETGENIPNLIVNLHAPMDVIAQRIQNRMNAGDSTEINWGFNALFYISKYQKRLSELITAATDNGIQCQSYDTSTTSPEVMLSYIYRKLAGAAMHGL